MKIIIIFAMLFALHACSSSQSKESEAKNPFNRVSWQSEKIKEFMLIRPIDYDKNATDVYHLPIREGQWYLIYKGTDCYLLPVYTDGGMGPSFIENLTKWNKIAIIDTMIPSLVGGSTHFEGLSLINKMEVVCFKDSYHIMPSMTSLQQQTVVVIK